jgi:high-affinity iron transporter
VLANFLIGLREGLEASLVVGILIAYLIRTGRRDRLPAIWAGVGAAIAASLLVGALLTFSSATLSPRVADGFGGMMSLIAVAFVTWMIFWIRRTARSIRSEFDERMERAVAMGTGALVLTALVAVGREGLETALFVWSAVESAGEGPAPLFGVVLGLALAGLLGYLLYRGAVRIDLVTFFTVTSVGLIIVAAGVLSNGVHDLQSAGLLPGLDNLAFDVSEVIVPGSLIQVLLAGVFHFSPATTWLEAAVWTLYAVPVMCLFLRPQRERVRVRVPLPSAVSPPSP